MNKLVIDASGFEHGKTFGYESYLMNLLKYFSEHRNELLFDKVIVACDNSQIKYFESLVNLNICGLKSKSYWQRFKAQNNFWRLFNLSKDDVIFFPGNYSALIKHCHHVLVVHDLLFLRKQLIKNRLFRLQRSLFIPRSLKIADKIITISKWVKKDLEEHYPKLTMNKVQAIYSYFDFNKFGNQPSDKVNVFSKGTYFLVVSADYPHKHVAMVVDAFALYATNDSKLNLIIVGRMSEDRYHQISQLKKNIKERIFIFKNISDDDLAYLYRNAKAYISATEFEGLGMPLVEAMYHGDKVISSNIEVAREVTMNKAIYFNIINQYELLYIMQHIDEYPKIDKLQNIITEKYSDENTSGKYIELLNSFRL